jgi:hypothetical protein
MSRAAAKRIKATKDEPKIRREDILKQAKAVERILEIEREQAKMVYKHRDRRYKG